VWALEEIVGIKFILKAKDKELLTELLSLKFVYLYGVLIKKMKVLLDIKDNKDPIILELIHNFRF